MQQHPMRYRLLLLALGTVMNLTPLGAAPLKVYLMSGQSNMQGFCGVHPLHLKAQEEMRKENKDTSGPG
jgi:hypothetical protein